MSQTCLSNNKTASLRLRHLRHAHVANCLSSPHPRLDAMQNRGIETELGEPVPKKNPKPLQTRWANQYLKKNPKPLQTRWANQYLKKSETPPDPLGEPVLKKIRNPSRPVGRTST